METGEFRKQLETRRAELVERMVHLEEWLDEPADPDAEERATERESDEVFEAQGLAGQREVAAIDAALQRMEAGQYGVCQNCGEAISFERLNAVPHAALCRYCMV